MDLGSQLHSSVLVALNTESGVYREFGSEMTGMSQVRQYKDAEQDCIWRRDFLCELHARRDEVVKGTGTGHENGTGKKWLSEQRRCTMSLVQKTKRMVVEDCIPVEKSTKRQALCSSTHQQLQGYEAALPPGLLVAIPANLKNGQPQY
ncbi:hypothetical protein ARMSODRAFT_974061 [Armillaria solidipes]|uniref:Uncharacterized protein n=1 Tax=Armillaria solidipes TaxID=1076256 RepID=A0A2H3BUZ6_9AGAR|nr:hypothetical protein ARMSODRAFT_974061 [Armillaria solidipes]